jgi:hypothetical protein
VYKGVSGFCSEHGSPDVCKKYKLENDSGKTLRLNRPFVFPPFSCIAFMLYLSYFLSPHLKKQEAGDK